jgi:hypothetical protein
MENEVGHRGGAVGKQVEGVVVGTPTVEWFCILGQEEQTGQSVNIGANLRYPDLFPPNVNIKDDYGIPRSG